MVSTSSFLFAFTLALLQLVIAAPTKSRPTLEAFEPTLLGEAEAQILLDTYPSRGSDSPFVKRDSACLDSTTTALDINSLLYYGGEGYVVSLCPNAVIDIEEPIFFYAQNQQIITEGLPTGDDRALLQVVNNTVHYVIMGNCDACGGVALRSIQIDGGRLTLGWLQGGGALVELGGNTFGQVVDNCHFFEPRGWSCLHAIEGWHNTCNSMFITNNQIGPCGNAPNNGAQFKKRDTDWTTPTSSLTVFTGQEWADGISLACKNSTVTGNVITDPTDGGIVLFNAPGSTITGNTVIASTRVLMGGINAVDDGPFDGDFGSTYVANNHIISQSSMIKVGIAVGGMTWGSDNRTASRTSFGIFNDNIFSSGPNGFFGYAIAVAGHENATVLGNDATNANFGGMNSGYCFSNPKIPQTQAFVYDQWTTPGRQLQNNFETFPLVFLICQQPGPIVATGPVTDLVANVLVNPNAPAATSTVVATAIPTQSALPAGSYSPINLVYEAMITALSQVAPNYAYRVGDGQFFGYEDVGGEAGGEWQSQGGLDGTTLTLKWSSAVEVAQVILYDRPDSEDQCYASTLTFDNGGVVQVGTLPNWGEPYTVSFDPVSTKSIVWNCTTVSPYTGNIGLMEIQVYGLTTSPTAMGLNPPNWARYAIATASSEIFESEGQRAMDGQIAGYVPGIGGANINSDTFAEWTTANEGVGASLLLTWTSAQTLSSLSIYDRPNLNDWITGATVTFSDGSMLYLTALNNDGSATVFNFPAVSTTTLLFKVTSVASTSTAVGLAEIQAYSAHSSASGATTLQFGVKPSSSSSSSIRSSTYASSSTFKPTSASSSSKIFASSASPSPISSSSASGKVSSSASPSSTSPSSSPSKSSATLASSTYSGKSSASSSSASPSSASPSTASSSFIGKSSASPSSASLSTRASSSFSSSSATGGSSSISSSATPGSSSVVSSSTSSFAPLATPVSVSGTAIPPATSDLALFGRAISTSYTKNPSSNAIDGSLTTEWVSTNQKVGAGLKVYWSIPVQVSSVVLYDRVDLENQILGGVLWFSDNSHIAIGALNNDGSATVIPLNKTVTTTSILLQVTQVSSTTTAVGLTELSVFGPFANTYYTSPSSSSAVSSSAKSTTSSAKSSSTLASTSAKTSATQSTKSSSSSSAVSSSAKSTTSLAKSTTTLVSTSAKTSATQSTKSSSSSSAVSSSAKSTTSLAKSTTTLVSTSAKTSASQSTKSSARASSVSSPASSTKSSSTSTSTKSSSTSSSTKSSSTSSSSTKTSTTSSTTTTTRPVSSSTSTSSTKSSSATTSSTSSSSRSSTIGSSSSRVSSTSSYPSPSATKGFKRRGVDLDQDALAKLAVAAFARATPSLPQGAMNPFALAERERQKARQ